jgi:transcriptional regulator with XRE-family HTH domain
MLPSLSIIPDRRRKLGLTQKKLAELAGVSQSYIAKLEAGNLEPSYIKVQSIFEAIEKLEKRQELSAADIMNEGIVGIQLDTTVQKAIEIMRIHGYSQLPVLDGERSSNLKNAPISVPYPKISPLESTFIDPMSSAITMISEMISSPISRSASNVSDFPATVSPISNTDTPLVPLNTILVKDPWNGMAPYFITITL